MNPDPRRPRILYYGGAWPTNIGNAFIDLGAMALLKAAAPYADVGLASQLPAWLFAREHAPGKVLDVASVTACDMVVFAGMAMCQEFIDVNGPAVAALARRGVPVVLLGTGGLTFDDAEVAAFRAFLRAVEPAAFVSRDPRSFEAYRDAVRVARDGIDCGFFVPEAFTPFAVDLPPYAVLNFDAQNAPSPETPGLLQVFTHHECVGRIPPGRLRKPRTLISDLPQDYLTLYAHATEVHTDRVHACVAALAYGRRARFYGTTPRASLFTSVGAAGVTSALHSPDLAEVAAAKRRQVDVVREIVATVLKREPGRNGA